MSASQQVVEQILSSAGISINGEEPFAIKVHDERFFKRVLADRSLGLGESYVEGRWDCEQLDTMFTKLLRADLYDQLKPTWRMVWAKWKAWLFNLQSKRRARKDVSHHYDLDAAFYFRFLDPYNQYSCAYFKDTDDLATAQEQKLDLICQKLQLQADDHLLDIGCGWGGLATYATEHYGCKVTGISLSRRQVDYAQHATKELPIDIKYQDYRDLTGTYDKVVSVGMIEHIGNKNYRTMMRKVQQVLADDGLFLLHTIGGSTSTNRIDQRIDKYIFPGAVLPSAGQLSKAVEDIFVIEDWHNFGQYYDPTLVARRENFSNDLDQLRDRYDEEFIRTWKYYFLSCAGSFRSRYNQLYQLVLHKQGRIGGYASVR